MICGDQSAIVACLASPATHAGAAVERIETHASMVFLAGDGAFKLKCAVRYDYLDSQDPASRHWPGPSRPPWAASRAPS